MLQEIPGQVVDFFQSRNIQPRAAKEEERKKIAAQLSLTKKTDPNKQLDMHQSILKEALIGQAQAAGVDTFQAQDVIEERGLWENSLALLQKMQVGQHIINPLKLPKTTSAPQGMPVAPQSQPYGY